MRNNTKIRECKYKEMKKQENKKIKKRAKN